MKDATSIREQLARLERQGLSALEARMVVVPRLWLRSRGELEEAWRFPTGAYREKRLGESCGFWQRFWANLRTHLEAQDLAAATAEIDRAVERVEPWSDEATRGLGDAGTRR